MNSFNHYAYGAVGAWMVRSVAGLAPDTPGFRRILFRPRPGGSITWAEAHFRTPQGPAGIRWDLHGDRLDLVLTVPPGATGRVCLDGFATEIGELTAGVHRVTARRI
jgi:alpha-L-rhamnosidase